MKNRKEVFLLIALTLCSGCAFGNRYNYHATIADLEPDGTYPVAVGTHDQRDYIVSGSKGPTYVGNQKSGFGIPYNVNTVSKKPLADDITSSVCASLEKKGFEVRPIIIDYSLDSGAAIRELTVASPERAVLLILHEWKSSTYFNTSLHYKVDLKVFDAEGIELAESNIEGKDALRGSANKAAPMALKEKLKTLFNQPQIIEALRVK